MCVCVRTYNFARSHEQILHHKIKQKAESK